MYPEDSGRGDGHAPGTEQDQRERTLEWLLEQDLSEPADALFTVADGGYTGDELSEREAAVAGRPMFGTNAAADDLSAFVDEEIVLSGEHGSTIYGEVGDGGDVPPGAPVDSGAGVMAIDHRRRALVAGEDLTVDDGVDILGLMDDDDIGSRPLALQRSRAARLDNPAVASRPEAGEPGRDERGEDSSEETRAQRVAEMAPAAPVATANGDSVPPETAMPGTREVLAADAADGEAGAGDAKIATEPEPLPEPASTQAGGTWLSDGADEIFDDSLALDPVADEFDLRELPESLDDILPDEDSEASFAPDSDLMEGLDALAESGLQEQGPALPEAAFVDELESPEAAGDVPAQWLSAASEPDAGHAHPEPAEERVAPEETGIAPDRGDDDAEAGATDVLSYVNRNAPPSDDSEFDRYLLRGEHLSDAGYDFDSLAVERTEGVVSVDPALDPDLDYHQDFNLPRDFNPGTVAVLTGVIGPAMEELAAAVEERLQALALPADSVALDAMLAIDPLSRQQCVDEGYAPIAGVCARLPDALAHLEQAEREAFCVRLAFRASGETCNDLFREDYSPAAPAEQEAATGEHWAPRDGGSLAAHFDFDMGGAAANNEFARDEESANDAELEPDSGRDVAPPALWAEEPPAYEVEEPLALEEEEPSAHEVEEPLAYEEEEPLAPEEEERFALEVEEPSAHEEEEPTAPGIIEPSALEEMDPSPALPASEIVLEVPGDEEAADLEGIEALDVPPSLDPDVEVELEIETETGADVPAPEIFSAADLDDWEAEGSVAGDGADLDALLQSFGSSESDIGDICGVAVDEFDAGAVIPAPTAVGEESPEGGAAIPPAGVVDAAAQVEGDLAWCIPSNIRFSYTSRSGSEVFRDFLDAFLEEGAVELEKLEDAVGAWEQDVDSSAGRDVVPRVLHTLKGIAKGVGLQRYGTLIHNFETLLAGLARPAPAQEADYFRIVNAWLDAAVQGFDHIQATQTDVASELPQAEGLVRPPQPLDAALAVDTLSEVHADQHPAAPAKERQQDKQLADEGAKALAAQQTIRMTSEALDNLLNLNNQAQQLGVRASQSTFRSKRAGAELLARLSSVRSHITKIADRELQNVTARGSRIQAELDALEMDQYSELQEAASILREAIEDLDDLIHVSSRQSASAEALLKQQAAVVTSLGSAIRDARVVPVSRLMPGLRRIVRTVGADLGKSVNFRVLNEIGKLDRDSHVCCQIILEHMVRNALDHGIEAPGQRLAAGKPETGLVSIDVSKEGSDYLIRLSDDGRGMNPDALREAALDRGLDVNAAELNDHDALRLIFHKGFSTASHLSEISGRGVGMDIVLSELQQIGGDIDIDSTPGVGTTFIVRVPSNVNVNGALLVTAAETSYAIPLDGLIAVEHIAVEDFYRSITAGEPLRVYEMDCDPAYLATLCGGASLPDPVSWGQTVPVIVAGSEERYMAIAVDDVTEALELVIRSMGAQFSQVPGVAGGATTSDGQAIVALDLNALVRNIAASSLSAVSYEGERQEHLLVLVVDDSRTQRMVATSQFDTLGVETVTAENGLVAIDLLNTTHRLPDVVLLDVEMPVKDGIQTLREIRKSERYRHLPVIMVTSRTGPKHRALAREAGCNGYMGKPFNFPVLVEQIVQLTGHELQIH